MTADPDLRPSGMTILDQRRVEAGIVKPIYELLCEKIGEMQAQAWIGEAIGRAAVAAGRDIAARDRAETSLERFAELFKRWQEGDAFDMELLVSDAARFDFNITRCGYADMYKEMGLGHIGHLLSCQRDGLLCQGYDPRITMTRTQTRMQGASHCDFRFRFSGISDETDGE